MKINWKKISFGFLVVLVLFILGTVGADAVLAIEYTPLAPLPGIEGAATSNLPEYLIALFKITLGLAAVLAVIQITIGGVEYMSTDAISGKEDGKERITQAIYGLILAIGAWLILNTVNPRILTFSLNPTPIEAPQQINTTTPRLGNVQKIKICRVTTNRSTSTPDIRTAPLTLPYDVNTDGALDRAYKACQQYQPPTPSSDPTVTRPASLGECPTNYNQVSYTCIINRPTQ